MSVSTLSQELIEVESAVGLSGERKELLRFMTCGSVDDGKSTLIGRLLLDSGNVYTDQLAALRSDSQKHGTTGEDFDPALLMDGLEDERQQGITIDVAYRYFATPKRKFIIADSPGHEQYTRNMATAASTVDLAIILVDARKGVITQTRRHSFIASLLGIKHLIVAVNKMDLVEYRQTAFDEIRSVYSDFISRLDPPDVRFIPVSALRGDNVARASEQMPWYQDGTLLHVLETVFVGSDRNLEHFRFPVQWVNRPDGNFRGYSGTVVSGIVRPGDKVVVLPSRRTSRVKSISTFDGDLPEAYPPLAVTLTLEDELDISRGDMLTDPVGMPQVATQLDAVVVWMSAQAMLPGKEYWLKFHSRKTIGYIDTLRHRVDIATLDRVDSAQLELNEIGECRITLNEPVAFDEYAQNRLTGSFVIVDRVSHETVGAGMVRTQRTRNTEQDHWRDLPQSRLLRRPVSAISYQRRQARYGQKPVTILITGLTASGKTTLAYALEERLFDQGRAATVLDGQAMRMGISKDLGFSAEERSENLRRSAEVAKLLNDAGLICIASFVAPSEDVRQKAGQVVGPERFLVVYLSTPVAICRQQDVNGHYRAADQGEIRNFPGVTASYEPPPNADLVLSTHDTPIEDCIERILELLKCRDFV